MRIIDSEIELFLKAKSRIYKYTSGGTEIQMFCPYCGDEFRKQNPRWGHLYISVEKGFFYCHRCQSKGTIIKLLTDLGYENQEKLNQLARIIGVKNIYAKMEDVKTTIDDTTIFEPRNLDKQTVAYLKERIVNFSIQDIYNYRIDCPAEKVVFYNNEPIIERYINKKIYKKLVSNQYYMIKKSEYSFVIAEGPFDVINIDKVFDSASTKICIGGKAYITAFKNIAQTLLNIYAITIYVDSDIDSLQLRRHLEKIVEKSNFFVERIEVKQNMIGKDVGEKWVLIT